MGQADLEIKIFFLIFFPKKERQVTICLAYFVCVCIYRNSLGEGLCHAMKQRWEDGSFDRGALVLHEGRMEGGYWKGLSYVAAPACSYQEPRASGAEGRKHNDFSRDSYLNTSDIL